MFSVGDRILYPMHGAGTIEKIEEKDILGKRRQYYTLNMPIGDMDVMIPVDNSSKIGIRPIIKKSEVDRVFDVLSADADNPDGNWNHRYRSNMEKLKTGDILKVAEVVRDLVVMGKGKHLSAGDQKMLNDAKEIMESEMILALDMEPKQVSLLVEEAV